MRPLFLFVCLALCTPAHAQTVGEQYLLSAINGERSAHGLGPLRTDDSLRQAAREHAGSMAARGTIAHQFPGEAELSARAADDGARFSRIAENVAEAPSVIAVHDALMRSPGHRANILDPVVDVVGIAVLSRRGQLYAVEDFARTVAPLTLPEQESAVAMLLDRAGLELTRGTDARLTCAQETGYAGARPDFVIRYTTANLALLPTALTERLQGGRERRAAVGACAPEPSTFTQYRLAVLLFR